MLVLHSVQYLISKLTSYAMRERKIAQQRKTSCLLQHQKVCKPFLGIKRNHLLYFRRQGAQLQIISIKTKVTNNILPIRDVYMTRTCPLPDSPSEENKRAGYNNSNVLSNCRSQILENFFRMSALKNRFRLSELFVIDITCKF